MGFLGCSLCRLMIGSLPWIGVVVVSRWLSLVGLVGILIARENRSEEAVEVHSRSRT